MTKEKKRKWEQVSKANQYWDSQKARQIQEIESKTIIKWLKDLNLPKYNILEVGCGNGHLGLEIASNLLSAGIDFTYHLTDLIPECIEKTKAKFTSFEKPNLIKTSILDIYDINETLGENTQEIIISTGFASAATYKDAIPAVSRSLKEEGILICDFINHYSPTVFLPNIPRSISRRLKVKDHANDPTSKYYHFGKANLKEYFARYDLELLKTETVRFTRNPLLAMFKKSDLR